MKAFASHKVRLGHWNFGPGRLLRLILLLWGWTAFLVCLLQTPAALAQAHRITVDDFSKLVGVSQPEISPDGKTIAFIVSRVDMKNDAHTSELYLLDIDTDSSRPLTHDRKGVASPHWSPSGDRLAFLAPAGPEKKKTEQVFVLPMAGGEALQVTRAEQGVEQFAWRPGGKEIAYVTADEPANKKAIEKHEDAFEVGNNSYLETAAPTPSHLWLTSAAGDKPRRLTSGAWSLPKSHPPGPPTSPISWSPDGDRILFTRQADPHFGNADETTLEVLDVGKGDIRKLTSHAKLEVNGSYSPDGSQIAYQYPLEGDPNRSGTFYVTASAGGDGHDATTGIDRNLVRAIWMPDGKSLLVGAHDGGTVAFWIQPLQGEARKLDLGDVVPNWLFWFDASVSKLGAIAFSGSESGHPGELYYLSSPDASPRRLTDFNHDVAGRDLGASEAFQWQGPDGFLEDGVVVYPPGFSKDHKYPLVLLIHGGPTAASTTGFNYLAQVLAANDFVIFQPNYRGSDNLGDAYQNAITGDAGDGPGRDVMAGIAALQKRGFIDESRIGVSGWSYGGYMTTWLIGHYQIWKAAVAGAPVTNMVDQYNLADFNVLERYGFQGSPWTSQQRMKSYREQSPLTYAHQVRTPTLLLHDVGDARVTITQAYAFYHALKDNGVPVRFFAYPTPGHFPGDPVRQIDVFRRWKGWLVEHLK